MGNGSGYVTIPRRQWGVRFGRLTLEFNSRDAAARFARRHGSLVSRRAEPWRNACGAPTQAGGCWFPPGHDGPCSRP